MASCFWRDSRRSARSWRMADSLSFSLLFPGTSPRVPVPDSGPSCLPSLRTELFCRLPFSAGDTLPPIRVSPADSCRLCRLGSRCSISFLKSECEVSRLCLRLAPTGSFLSTAEDGEGEEDEEEREDASFSADWTRLSRGERGGSALFGRDICLTNGGEEWSLTGKDWPIEEVMSEWLGRGEGERCGRCSEGWAMVYEPEGIMEYCLLTSGGGERYWRCSLGARPCKELVWSDQNWQESLAHWS